MLDINECVNLYIIVRDRLRALDEAHEKKRKALVSKQEELNGLLSKFMHDNNVKNLKTAAGTCYVSTRCTASLADADAFMNFVIANQRFDLMDRRANANAVREYVEQHNQLPPGCNLNQYETVGVRRESGK